MTPAVDARVQEALRCWGGVAVALWLDWTHPGWSRASRAGRTRAGSDWGPRVELVLGGGGDVAARRWRCRGLS